MMRCPAKRKKIGGPLPARGEPAMCGPALPGRKSRSAARVLPACLLGAAVLVASAHSADHAPVADMVRELRLPPLDAPPEFSLYDVWLQYRWQTVSSLIAAGLILLLGLRLLIGNRKLETAHRTVLRQKQQLEESEQRYRFLFSNNPLPMFVLAEDGLGFLEVNERAIEHYGFTREEFGRMTLYDIRTVEGVAELERAISSSPGSKILVEARHKKKGGAVIDVAINAMPLKYGEIPAWIALVQDITGRRALQRRMANQLLFIKAIINAEVNALAVCHDIDEPPYTRFTVWNPSMEILTGYRMDEINRLGWYQTVYTDPEIQEQARQRMERMRRGDHLRGEEWVITRKDGSLRVVQVYTVTVIGDERGTHTLAVMQDITERKQYEEELKRSNVELEHFGYAISHDMRQPLRMISSYLQLIEMELADRLNAEKRSYFDFAIEGAKRIDQMLVALLEYSRAGRMGEAPTWIDSRAALDEALLFLQPAIAGAQARLDIAGDWPRIFANRDEIVRLMQNLIGNAVKFRAAGQTPEIAVTGKKGKNEWHLCVADNGIGIIPDQTQRLFQVFQRLQLRTAYEGNGVGLALCRKIAEHHKGRIWAESAGEGRGSRFHVVLPVLREEK